MVLLHAQPGTNSDAVQGEGVFAVAPLHSESERRHHDRAGKRQHFLYVNFPHRHTYQHEAADICQQGQRGR
jgi:hypothetical protein